MSNTEETYRRVYNKKVNVYEAANERLEYIFANFPRIYLSFSGGKDSGVMLNLTLDYMRKHGITKKIGLMVTDNEANYDTSLEFMKRIIDANRDLLDVYWICMPITMPCTVSTFHYDWQTWGERDKERWIRPRPTDDYVVTIENHPFGDAYVEDMWYDKFWHMFGKWYAQGEDCACMIGIRTQESLRRYLAIMAEKKGNHGRQMWTKKESKHVYNVYPIYDWTTEDIWTANAKFDWDYNKLYDIFYRAGMPLGTMRVASPFMSEAKSSLAMYRVIDPHIWARLCARVQGANFAATYGKQLNYATFKLPEGHTWKSFTKFLLDTLPEDVAANFKRRFIQSFRVWSRKGKGLPESVIQELSEGGVKIKINGNTPHGRGDRRVRILGYPDHVDMVSKGHRHVASWKRFAITILKNDHTCKYMGLAPTQEQQRRQKTIQEKYKDI